MNIFGHPRSSTCISLRRVKFATAEAIIHIPETCAPTSTANTGLRSYAEHITSTWTVQEVNVFHSKL